MRRIIAGSMVLILIAAFPAIALERDSIFVESIEGVYREYDLMEAVGVRIVGEQEILARDDWGLVVELGWGQTSHDGDDGTSLWLAELGFKRFLPGENSILLSGGAEWIDSGDDFSAAGLSLTFQHRFEPTEAAISPYAEIEAAVRAGESTHWATGASDDFAAGVFAARAGCDFMIGRDVVLMVNGTFTDSLKIEGGPFSHYADGWSVGIGLKYFWHIM